MDEWDRELRAHRTQKDQFFAEHPNSPLTETEREQFDGLDYYEPAPEYRYLLELERETDPNVVAVPTTDDGTQTYERCGWFPVEIGGTEYKLWAYRNEDDDRLWVPFRDLTNGETTYEGGRYIDLGADDRRGDTWQLDFNRAYTPFCVYAATYECPLVPEENTLDMVIEAGERYPY